MKQTKPGKDSIRLQDLKNKGYASTNICVLSDCYKGFCNNTEHLSLGNDHRIDIAIVLHHRLMEVSPFTRIEFTTQSCTVGCRRAHRMKTFNTRKHPNKTTPTRNVRLEASGPQS